MRIIKSLACYIILKEKEKGGFDIEKVYVPFNKNRAWKCSFCRYLSFIDQY